MSNSVLLKSSLVKKYWMSATGLFLCLFLVGHLAGNLQLLIAPENGARDTFNLYGKFMTTNPLVRILSIITYISIVFHAADGILLAIQNRKARPVSYAKTNPSANSTWSSRNMALLGSIILIFIILHMMAFWKRMHFGPISTYLGPNGEELKDLYSITIQAFQDPEYGMIACVVYLVAMLAVMMHLLHGFQSAFQSVGIRHAKHTKTIKLIGFGFALLIPLAFAYIPFHIRFIL